MKMGVFNNMRMKPIAILGLILITFLSTTTIRAAGTSYEIDAERPTLPKAHEFYKAMVLHEKTAKYQIDVEYPFFNNQAADKAVQEYTQGEMQAFMEYAIENAEPDMPHMLNINFEVTRFTEGIVSIVLSEWQFTGGAHNSDYYKTFTVDLADSQIIGFDEMFTDKAAALKVIAEIVKSKLKETLGGDLYEDALSPQESSFEAFELTSYDITFLFAADTIVPHVLGPQQAVVSLSEEKLKPFLKKPFRQD
jgi:hypothetical protein